MATVRPFCALRPADPAAAGRIAAPPYDVIDTREARALAAGRRESFLHVSRPEIDLPEATDEHAPEVHARARLNLDAFEARGVLRRDAEPRLYLYAQTLGAHRQVGIVGCTTVAEYLDDTIRKHERTRPDKEDDRTRHIAALGAHDEPVFLTYRAHAAIDAEVATATRAAPACDFLAPDGVRHTVWVPPAGLGARLAGLFRDVPVLYVADGHHRSAAAARVHAQCAGRPGEHDAFLAVLFPHDQVRILAYNRLVLDRRRRSPQALLDVLAQAAEIEPASRPQPEAPGRCGVYVGGGAWWQATLRESPTGASDPVAALDCSRVQDELLAPLFGIDDPRRDVHVGFVGGIRGAGELERRVDSGEWSLALFLYPTSVQQLLAVSDAGRLMPPKSTWFEPKLRSGLFVHRF